MLPILLFAIDLPPSHPSAIIHPSYPLLISIGVVVVFCVVIVIVGVFVMFFFFFDIFVVVKE